MNAASRRALWLCTAAACVLAGAGAGPPAAAALEAGPAAAGPDLVVAAVSRAPGRIALSLPFRVGLDVRNRGQRASRPTAARLYVSRDAVRDRSDIPLAPVVRVKSLRPRGSVGVAWTHALPARAPKGVPLRLIACVDPARKVREAREGNNCRTAAGTLTVRGKFGPGGVAPEYRMALSLRSDQQHSCIGGSGGGTIAFTIDYEWPRELHAPLPFVSVGGGGDSGQAGGTRCLSQEPCGGGVNLVRGPVPGVPPGVPETVLRVSLGYDETSGVTSAELLAGVSDPCGFTQVVQASGQSSGEEIIGDRVIRVPLSNVMNQPGHSENTSGVLTLTRAD
jgi:hypothetical protein